LRLPTIQADRDRYLSPGTIVGRFFADAENAHHKRQDTLLHAFKQLVDGGLITNGSLFDETNSRALLDAGIDMIEFSVDACDSQTYAIVRKGLEWDTLVENTKRMLLLRNTLKRPSKIVASAVVQTGVDINAVEKYWVDGIGVDYLIKHKFLTWGDNTTLDGSRSSDPAAYLFSSGLTSIPVAT
jgi:hypothetical protein